MSCSLNVYVRRIMETLVSSAERWFQRRVALFLREGTKELYSFVSQTVIAFFMKHHYFYTVLAM